MRASLCVAGVTLVTVTLASASAFATPNFPSAVVRDLGLNGVTIDPPQGCTLCHPTDTGGTSLRPFGNLLQEYGVAPYDEPSLATALAQVTQNEPQLIDDIRNGVDPNGDIKAATSVHTPENGCAVGRGAPAPGWWLALVAWAAMRRRKRDQKRD
jgi:MYXO-CTERM domain-containing protein